MVNFPTWVPDCDFQSPALLDLFLYSDASIFSTIDFPPLGNSDHVAVTVSIDFPSYSQQDALFHHITYDYSCADWDSLCDHLRVVPWEDIFKLSASAAASEFCEWVQVEIDVYIPHQKYQVKSHSSPWFSAACAKAIVDRNHFLRLHQKDKSSEFKVQFRQVSNHGNHWWIAISVLNKGKSAIPPPFNNPEVFLLHLITQNCLLKIFLITLILMTQASLYLFSLLEII